MAVLAGRAAASSHIPGVREARAWQALGLLEEAAGEHCGGNLVMSLAGPHDPINQLPHGSPGPRTGSSRLHFPAYISGELAAIVTQRVTTPGKWAIVSSGYARFFAQSGRPSPGGRLIAPGQRAPTTGITTDPGEPPIATIAAWRPPDTTREMAQHDRPDLRVSADGRRGPGDRAERRIGYVQRIKGSRRSVMARLAVVGTRSP